MSMSAEDLQGNIGSHLLIDRKFVSQPAAVHQLFVLLLLVDL